ncbi:hypothetical protein [Bythopirellula goksoeyrii]|uniref:Uncharacterized protein n=1 Tax=Bythopirellula goksoeyrii TaxID=1400387 RepID=A0A5B9QHN3_9BACT|nr:hypothetical protein [Bythopirellula goksoeyrii]QEG37162.1 hypothetical protein Pr1d_45030 [Bythopirellula goksoeyrii]
MAKKRLESKDAPISRKVELLERLNAKAQSYSTKATLLSNALVEAEEFLQHLSGKIEVSVPMDSENTSLSFGRFGSNWCLLMDWQDDEGNERSDPITQLSLDMKALAAEHLGKLYAELQKHFDELETRLDDSLASLRELPFLDLDELAENCDQDIDFDEEGGQAHDEITF